MQNKLRIVFMGTPDFAVASLKALLDAKQNIVGIVTVPDKPAGRGQKIIASPVKNFAEKLNLSPILQPESLKSPAFIEKLKELRPDLLLVVAFRMLPESVWSIPPKGTVNLHASLLPNYRGAAPINWAIMNGETETGVTSFFIEKEIDTGKIIYSRKVPIDTLMNAGNLHDLLMVEGANLLVRTVESIAHGNYPAIEQQKISDGSELRPAPKIFKENCRINWKSEGKEIYNFIRGLSPYPTAWTELVNGKDISLLKIFEATFEKHKHDSNTGLLIIEKNKSIRIAVKDGFINIKNLQLAGKKRMNTEEFLKGFQNSNDCKVIS
jgi:methionyl-tRNA formyltransferase